MITALDESQLLTAAEFDSRSRMSKASRYRAMRDDPTFPRPIRMNPLSPRSRLRFRLTDVIRWIEEKQECTAAAKEEGAGSLSIHLGR